METSLQSDEVNQEAGKGNLLSKVLSTKSGSNF